MRDRYLPLQSTSTSGTRLGTERLAMLIMQLDHIILVVSCFRFLPVLFMTPYLIERVLQPTHSSNFLPPILASLVPRQVVRLTQLYSILSNSSSYIKRMQDCRASQVSSHNTVSVVRFRPHIHAHAYIRQVDGNLARVPPLPSCLNLILARSCPSRGTRCCRDQSLASSWNADQADHESLVRSCRIPCRPVRKRAGSGPLPRPSRTAPRASSRPSSPR